MAKGLHAENVRQRYPFTQKPHFNLHTKEWTRYEEDLLLRMCNRGNSIAAIARTLHSSEQRIIDRLDLLTAKEA